MLPLGVLAASGSGGAGAYELISTTTLSSLSSTVTFSSIPQTYQHLELRVTARTNANIQNSTQIRLRMNGDTGSNYAYHDLYGNGSSAVSNSAATQPEIRLNGFGDTSVTNNWGVGIVNILDYKNTNKNKVTRLLAGTANNSYYNRIYLSSGVWINTAAITSLTLNELNGYGWTSGSRFSLYGIKGA